MSLLLDALKKAAEQKAEKNRQEIAETQSSDETVIEATAEDVSELEDGGLQQPPRGLQDETEIDASADDTHLEQTREAAADGTETRLETPDHTETETRPASAQMQTGEDETIIFAEDDVADFMGEPKYVSRDDRAAADETDLSQLASSDEETEFSPAASADYGDETDLSQLAPRDDETDVGQTTAGAYGDETDLSQLAPRDDETDIGEVAAAVHGDETDLSQLAPRDDDTDISQPFEAAQAVPSGDETDIGEQPAVADETELPLEAESEDETDISVPPHSVADLEHAEAQRAAADETDMSQVTEAADDTDITDEDMSLLLVDRDQTNLTSPTSATDPQIPQDQIQALQSDAPDEEELALVDTTRHRGLPEAAAGATMTSATATTNVNQDTQTTRSATTSTQTSTRTYAPDNYDRTLMRLPSDDASKLFAGMKSDSDVVMTPEYAKKVFRSKSSAQRMQQYKIYGGITFAILLVIAIFGLFEFQAQQDSIDTSLRPLKRDPMPGLIKSDGGAKQESLFAEAEIDERAKSLIESATSEPAADEPTADETVEATADEAGADEAPAMQAATEDEAEPASSTSQIAADDSQAPAEDRAVMVAGITPASSSADDTAEAAPATDTAAAGKSASSLQISSSERLEEKHLWLREAYAAYQSGDDELAMEIYNKVLEIDPGNRNALLARAAIHVHNNNNGDAIADYQKLLLANPKDSLALTSLITVANYSPRETETQLKLMIRENPESPYLNFALANAYGAQDRWLEAQGHYYTALQNNPGDPNYAYNLAVSLEHISKPRAAMAYYQRALDNLDNGLATFSKDVVDQRLEVLGKL